MIEAHIEYAPLTQGHKVWLIDRSEHGPPRIGAIQTTQVGDDLVWLTWDPAEEPAPTLHFPSGALEALMTAANHVVSSTDATLDALADARGIRDRLLVLIENRWSESS